jgi:hypothetical protein
VKWRNNRRRNENNGETENGINRIIMKVIEISESWQISMAYQLKSEAAKKISVMKCNNGGGKSKISVKIICVASKAGGGISGRSK